MRVLVVNADDFGLSPGVNLGILKGIHEGILTSTSMMVNGPSAAHAFDLAKEHPEIDIGVHLNATDFAPLLHPHKVSSLSDGNGLFRGIPHLLAVALASRRARRELRAEWHEQISRALSLGVPISHLDSHHHVHMAPWIFEIAASLAEEFRIPYIRISDEGRSLGASPALRGLLSAFHPRPYKIKRYMLSAAAALDRRRKGALRSADFFVDTFLPQGPRPIYWLRAVISALPRGVTELICHPALPDQSLQAVTSYTLGRQQELEQLTDPSWGPFLQRVGVTLSSFRELAAQ